VNTRVTEVPPGKDDPVERADGPTAGSASRRGGGGDYLSNEIAYRNTLLRDRAGRHIPAGHIHLPEPGENEGQADLLAQVRSMVEVVAASVGNLGLSKTTPADRPGWSDYIKNHQLP